MFLPICRQRLIGIIIDKLKKGPKKIAVSRSLKECSSLGLVLYLGWNPGIPIFVLNAKVVVLRKKATPLLLYNNILQVATSPRLYSSLLRTILRGLFNP